MSEGNRSRSRLLPSLLGLLILLSGLALLAGGIKLASLGGSLYYLLAGIGLALSGLLLLLGKRAALGLYALVLFASTVWALWEVGLDWWQLVPRLALWFVFGLLLWLPWFRRPLLADGPAPLGTAALGVAVVLAGAAAVGSQFTNPGQIVGRIDRDSGMTSTAPAMPKPAKGTEFIKFALSQASKDMREVLIPMAIPALAAHLTDVKFMYSDNKYYEMCGQMGHWR